MGDDLLCSQRLKAGPPRLSLLKQMNTRQMNVFPRALLMLALLVLSGNCGDAVSEQRSEVRLSFPESCTFANPVAEGQDPWVVRRDGWYYLVESSEGAIYVYRSAKLTEIKKNGVRVWQAPEDGWNQAHIWAPELHFMDGRWYIYYAAGR
ncbi:MAG TPA: family 43 glycosylhydrolase, partial [Chloroflexota bacterium]|nr:family 43 glycosylhydrolase [Chloroflexota bacterium]